MTAERCKVGAALQLLHLHKEPATPAGPKSKDALFGSWSRGLDAN